MKLGAYGITFSFHGKKALDEVSFEISGGETIALLGPNGSGKSTLLKVVAGILSLDQSHAARTGVSPGQVRLNETDFLAKPPSWRARRIAYVPPELSALFPLTAYETVLLGRSSQGHGYFRNLSDEDESIIQWAMESCFCWGLKDRDLHTLSGGERQLVSLARALAQGAKVLFLDEALSKMDLHHQAEIGKMLKGLAGKGYAIVLVSHDVNLALELAEQCLLLKDGRRLASGPVTQVFTTENIQKLYPSSSLALGTNPATGSPKVFFTYKS